MKRKIFTSVFLLFTIVNLTVCGQKTVHYNLARLLQQNKTITSPASGAGVLEGDRPGAMSTVNTVWFKDIQFSEGTIDIDLRGKNEFLKSFLGIVFHRADSITYDVLYFRPFNFQNADTARRKWSVQYMSLPDNDFAKLRKEYPLVYENAIEPPPDPNDWFHAHIVVDEDSLKVYVNKSSKASLEVRLLNKRRNGELGLFSDGLKSDFANLTIIRLNNNSQKIRGY